MEKRSRKMENKNERFEYTYSSEQQKEIEQIRKKYLPPMEDKMEQLRKLDQSTTTKGMIYSITLGIVGTLIFGLGLCCSIEWGDILLVPGIIIGLLGMITLGIAYPVYVRVTKKEREKIAPQILALTEELTK